MKMLILIIVVIFYTGQSVYAQKKQYSDYNLRRATELLGKNKSQEAAHWIDEHLKMYPNDSDAFALRACAYRDDGYIDYAVAELSKALEYWNDKCQTELYWIHEERGVNYMYLKEYDKALVDLDKAYTLAKKKYKHNAEDGILDQIVMQQAHIYYTQKKYAEADKIYKEMIERNESEISAILGLARNMIAREGFQKAIPLLDKCAQIDYKYDQVYRFRMKAYSGLGNKEKAIDDAIAYCATTRQLDDDEYVNVLKSSPRYAIGKISEQINQNDNWLWRMHRGLLFEYIGDYRKAIADYEAIELKYGADAELYSYKAESYRQLGLMDDAIEQMTNAIALGDNGSFLYCILSRADYYRLAGKYREAIADFTKYIEQKPTDVFGYYRRGWCYELMGDDKSAMDNYNAGIELDKTYPYLYLMRGEQYLKQGDIAKANADFEQILKLDNIANENSCRQYALHFLGRDTEAIEWMNEIIKKAPNNKDNYYDQACLYARMGKKREAVSALHTALEKGYRSFAHIAADDDLDTIRELPEFKVMIKEYKGKIVQFETNVNDNKDTVKDTSVVQMRKLRSGVYEIPCTINGLQLKFIFDTGASDVSISSVEAAFMLKNSYLKDKDIVGKAYYSTATGEIHEGTKVILREIKIGDAILRDVEASVTHSQQAPLLLGQSVMERFGVIAIDNTTSKLTIKQR